jgi:O-antigen/teichoic acid export membrane protein
MNKPPGRLGAVAARGVAWTGGAQILRQLIQVAGQLILVRLLQPDDFGLLGMAMFFIGMGQLLADFGVGSALVQSRTHDERAISSCFWLNLGVAAVLAALVLACAPLVGRFYGRVDLAPLIAVLSLNLLLSGLQVVPNALLYRDLRFGQLARAQVTGSVVGAVAAISLAAAGAGVWSLVAQPLVGTTAHLVLTWHSTRWVPRWTFDTVAVKPLARFSAALLGTNLIGYGNRNIDNLLIGRFLGAGPLGHYAMAVQLMLYPLQQVSSVIVRVLFPTLVQIKDDLPRLRGAYLKAVGTIAFVTFPLMGGLFSVADDFVTVVFGPTWAPMVPALRVLCWVGMMQSVGTTVGSIYLAIGRPESALRVTLTAAPVIAAGIAAGLPWGIHGVALGYATASFLLFYYTAHNAFRLVDLRLGEFHRAVLRPLVATALMVGGMLLVARGVATQPPAVRLGVGIGTGAVLYVLVSLALNRQQVRELVAVVRNLRRR